MKQYDVKCPICGTWNRGLFLDETDGWMECEHCGNETQDGEYRKKHTRLVPVFRMDQIPQLVAAQEAVR